MRTPWFLITMYLYRLIASHRICHALRRCSRACCWLKFMRLAIFFIETAWLLPSFLFSSFGTDLLLDINKSTLLSFINRGQRAAEISNPLIRGKLLLSLVPLLLVFGEGSLLKIGKGSASCGWGRWQTRGRQYTDDKDNINNGNSCDGFGGSRGAVKEA